MQKLIGTTFVALLLAAALVAFRGPGPKHPDSPAPKDNQVPTNKRQRVRDSDTLGREVDIDSARRCVKLFAALAVKNRLSPREEKRYPNFRRSRVTTTGEVFSGRKLLAWLQSTDSLYDSQKLTMHLNVQLGIYTEDFLRTYHPNDERLRKKLLGRVGIFIIPLDSVTKFSIDRDGKLAPEEGGRMYSKASVRNGPNPAQVSNAVQDYDGMEFFGGKGGKGYDLGGIQP